MTSFRIAVLAVLFSAGGALAQTAAPTTAAPATPAPGAAPAATAPAGADLTKDGKPRMKVVRAQCRDTIKGESLTGDARKQAMAACIIKQRPDMAARVNCQMDPSLKGMDKAARHTALQACVAKAKG